MSQVTRNRLLKRVAGALQKRDAAELRAIDDLLSKLEKTKRVKTAPRTRRRGRRS